MEELLREIFDAHYKDVYAYFYGLSRDASLSEDLASEVFLEAVRSIGSFRGEADVKTWLFTIARRRWAAWLRRKKRQIETEALQDFLPGGGKTVEARYLDRELAERVYALLEAEPERTRDIVRMRLEGYSFYEIGQKHGISENSARVIDFRARSRIRDTLKKEGFLDG